jgi:hypothetical protein
MKMFLLAVMAMCVIGCATTTKKEAVMIDGVPYILPVPPAASQPGIHGGPTVVPVVTPPTLPTVTPSGGTGTNPPPSGNPPLPKDKDKDHDNGRHDKDKDHDNNRHHDNDHDRDKDNRRGGR